MAVAAAPKYSIGQTVCYADNHDRTQHGEVRRIEASWNSYAPDKPLIIYSIWHPTYRNNHAYAAEKNIRCASPSTPGTENAGE